MNADRPRETRQTAAPCPQPCRSPPRLRRFFRKPHPHRCRFHTASAHQTPCSASRAADAARDSETADWYPPPTPAPRTAESAPRSPSHPTEDTSPGTPHSQTETPPAIPPHKETAPSSPVHPPAAAPPAAAESPSAYPSPSPKHGQKSVPTACALRFPPWRPCAPA